MVRMDASLFLHQAGVVKKRLGGFRCGIGRHGLVSASLVFAKGIPTPVAAMAVWTMERLRVSEINQI